MKLRYLLVLLFIGLLFHAYDVNAGCCVNVNTDACVQTTSQTTCTLPNVYFPQECTSLPAQCIESCCCQANQSIGNMFLNQTCKHSGGTLFPGIQFQADCDAQCSGTPSTFRLQGYVKNNSVLVPLANVTLVSSQESILTTVSSPGQRAGYYSFPNVPVGNIAIKAFKDECSWEGTVIGRPSEYNITLECCQYDCTQGQCTNGVANVTCNAIDADLCAIDQKILVDQPCAIDYCEWDCTGFPPAGTPCPSQGYWTQNCNEVLVPGCTHQTMPPLRQDCGGATHTCGNGIQESPEQCDFNRTTGLGDGGNCQDSLITGCNPDCTCYVPPASADCSMNPAAPNPLLLGHIYNELKIKTSWSLAAKCNEFVKNYTVFGCKNISGNCMNQPFIQVSPALPNWAKNFTVPNSPTLELFPNTQYCFYLETRFNSSVISGAINRSQTQCIQLGDQVCYGSHKDSWCGDGQTIQHCDQNNTLLSDPCGPQSYCSQLGNVAECKTTSACERCNGILGLFGYQGFNVPIDADNTLLCPTLLQKNTQLGCYLDYSTTSVDKTYSCEGVESCYDYKSRDSCQSDYCSKGSQLCEWQEYSKAFNKGVCRPKLQAVEQGLAQQHCEYCNLSQYNRIYTECTSDTCSLYGNCYYKATEGKCMDAYSLTCSDYDNAKDCTGGTNTVVDTRWIQSSNTWLRRSTLTRTNTNTLINKSLDAKNISRCYWDTRCFRNADNLSETVSRTQGKDCTVSAAERVKCERDITAPISSITHRSTYGRFIDMYSDPKTRLVVNDQWPLSDQRSTYSARNTTLFYYKLVTAELTEDSLYPDKILEVFPTSKNHMRINLPSEIDESYHGQQMTLYYFAEDAARNLETVKNFTFLLDLKAPLTTLTLDTDAYKDDNDMWFTDLFVTIDVDAETSMPIVCTFKMQPKNDHGEGYWDDYLQYDIPTPFSPPGNIINRVPASLHTTYFALESDTYDYEMRCTDDVGNSYVRNGQVRIEGDMTITNPLPNGTFTQQYLPKNISIETAGPGDCRYSMTTTDYARMEGRYSKSSRSTSESNYLHYDTMANAFGLDDPASPQTTVPSGIYRIYTACNLTINNKNVIVLGGMEDIIYFAVDDEAPKTRMLYDPNFGVPVDLHNFTNNESTDLLHLYLINDDDTARLTDWDNESLALGPNSTFYCIERADGNCPLEQYDPEMPIVFNYRDNETFSSTYGSYPLFCYYSTDMGGNKETTSDGQMPCIRLKLRNMDFLAPDIQILQQE